MKIFLLSSKYLFIGNIVALELYGQKWRLGIWVNMPPSPALHVQSFSPSVLKKSMHCIFHLECTHCVSHTLLHNALRNNNSFYYHQYPRTRNVSFLRAKRYIEGLIVAYLFKVSLCCKVSLNNRIVQKLLLNLGRDW